MTKASQSPPPIRLTRFSRLRALRDLAWVNVLVHLVALALTAIGIRPGSPLTPLGERLSYLASRPVGWTFAWVTWMFCAVALVAFLALVTHRLGEHAYVAQLGLIIAVVGAAFDLLCDSVYLLILPMLACRQPPPEALFLTTERVTGIASLVIANGAYSIAILMLTLALRGWQGRVRFTIAIGYAVAGFGMLLAAAGFRGGPAHAAWATLPTIGLFCVWVLLVTHSLEPVGRTS
jgi:hypothetical protein